MTSTGRPGQTSRREAAKAERRDRIVRAAIKLSQESGINGFSMRDLARVAEVSHATPFNLFGSKGEVISHIFDTDLKLFIEALTAHPSTDELERLFDMISIATDYFRQKDGLYRALHNSFRDAAADSVYQHFTESRLLLFTELIAAAQAQKFLRSGISTTLMARALYNQWEAIIHQWARGGIILDQVEKEVGFGFATLLSGFATAPFRDRLRAKMTAYQAELIKLSV